ncbi:MAG: cobaltochelatase subunit CobN, partial [Methanimicrococcus sp.]|nr:cobaltochelatase subunit CobN [Methanimicrococcus sp.]
NGDLSYLEREIQAYLIGQDSETNRLRQAEIVDRMFDAGIHNIIGIDHLKREINPSNPQSVTDNQVKEYIKGFDRSTFSGYLRDELFNYIEAIKENNLPYGMHVFGQSMTEEMISAMLRSMWGPPFDQILFETYYKDNGYAGIPYEDEQKILALVKDLEAAGSPAAMTLILENAFSDEKYEVNGMPPTAKDHEGVVRFIMGPIMDIKGSDANAVITEWKDNGVYDDLRDEIIFAYYFYTTEPSDAVIEGVIERMVQYCIDNKPFASGAELVNNAMIAEFKTQTHQNKAVVAYMTGYGRLEYADRLRDCGPAEMTAFMSSLSGGYILPSAGNDPIQNRDAVPTGRNFYGIDPTKFPTKSAWEVGKSLADQLLADYYSKYGEFPNTVAFSRFGTEFIRDEGALEACALYLLGVEPVWDINGNVDPRTVKVIPLSDLTLTLNDGTVVQRPRIDIVYTTAGMRDSFGDKLKLINVAVKTVSNLNEPPESNYVKVNTEALRANPATAPFADMRCFANELGNYEIGTGNLISASGSWDDPEAITNLYLSKMGHVYGDDSVWGVSAAELLRALLKNTDATIHASSSNLYDSLDNDDFFQYFGALSLAVKHSRDDGKLPEMYVADTRNVGQSARDNAGKVYTMKQFLNIDMESRYKNEKWIQGMMESGYSGSTMFSEFVDNLFGWAVTTDGQLVSFKDWEDVFDIYVSDKYDLGLPEYFQNNPYAYQSMTARMLESIRKEYWIAETDEQKEKLALMEQQLVDAYVQSVVDHGVACCHHTCGNPSFDAFVSGKMSVLGTEPDKQEKYAEQVFSATYRQVPLIVTPPPPPPSGSSLGTGYGTMAGTPGPEIETAGDGAGHDTTGYEMTTTTAVVNAIRDAVSSMSFSSSNIMVLIGIVGLCAAIFYGFKKKM